MSKIYTANDLIRYIYRETSPAEDASIMMQLQHDSSLRHELEEQLAAVLAMQNAGADPHPTSVSIIMEYSLKHQEVHN